MMTTTAPRTGALPTISAATIVTLIVSGAVATVAFDIWGQSVSPWLGLGSLSPDGLARSLLGTFGLPNDKATGVFVHLVPVGLIAYPAGYVFVFRPLWERFVGAGGWLASSAVYGAALWVFAIGGITTIAGLPTFLNFSTITWVALAGHVIYGIALGATLSAVEAKRAA